MSGFFAHEKMQQKSTRKISLIMIGIHVRVKQVFRVENNLSKTWGKGFSMRSRVKASGLVYKNQRLLTICEVGCSLPQVHMGHSISYDRYASLKNICPFCSFLEQKIEIPNISKRVSSDFDKYILEEYFEFLVSNPEFI